MKIILIMGLPGAGKTTLANELAKLIKAKRLNADEIRKAANDWDFSEEGRTRQSKRMSDAALKIKNGISFREFSEKSWKLPEEYYGNRYSCMIHGIGLCDEWPLIKYPTDGGQREGNFEKNMTITVETYIGKVGGKEGVKLEQQYLVGENNLELMSHHPLEDI